MSRDVTPATRAVMRCIESLGYRVGIACDDERGRWLATAKNDGTGQFHVAKTEEEATVIATLAEMVGIDVMDG